MIIHVKIGTLKIAWLLTFQTVLWKHKYHQRHHEPPYKIFKVKKRKKKGIKMR